MLWEWLENTGPVSVWMWEIFTRLGSRPLFNPVFSSLCLKPLIACLTFSWGRCSRLQFHLLFIYLFFSLLWHFDHRTSYFRKYSANLRRQHFLFILCLVSDPIFLPSLKPRVSVFNLCTFCHTEKLWSLGNCIILHFASGWFSRFNHCHLIWDFRVKHPSHL